MNLGIDSKPVRLDLSSLYPQGNLKLKINESAIFGTPPCKSLKMAGLNSKVLSNSMRLHYGLEPL